jgi:AraC-like DNA-binding protein
MSTRIRKREPTISVRLVWPFTRVLSGYSEELARSKQVALSLADFVNPEMRIPSRFALELLEISLARSGDPALGLHAGERAEPGDLDLVEHVARSSATVRAAILSGAKVVPLLDEAAEITLHEEGSRAEWRFSRTDVSPQPPALNEFLVVTHLGVARRAFGDGFHPAEVHLSHAVPTVASEYERVFRCPVKLGRPKNAIVLPRAALDLPMPGANPDMLAGFLERAEATLRQLPNADSIASKVRKLTAEGLGAGDIGMAAMARKLHMSVATLRRRLRDEGTTHSRIVDEVRFELAKRHLGRPDLAISEIAYVLGFSHVNAFHKAFKRWTGEAPLEYRSRARDRA